MRSGAWKYAVAAGGLVGAVALRWLLDPVMGNSFPLVTLFGAVALAVWVAGYRVAIAITLAGYIACELLFIEPRGTIEMAASNMVGFAAYLLTCAIIVWLGEMTRRARATVTAQREIYRVTLRSIGDAVITTDVDGNVTYLNAIAESLTGWSAADAAGKPLTDVFRIVSEDNRQPVESPAVRALREGVVVGLANHTLLIRRDGSECPIDDSAAPIRDEAGIVSGCVLIFRDVTAQRTAERDRANQLVAARLLASIVESSDDAIVSKTLDGVIQTWNAGAERIFGHRAADAIGKHISIIIPPDRVDEEERIIRKIRRGERIEHVETERLRADGTRVNVSISISPVRDGAGTIVGASKVARDITERRRTEAERHKLATLVESSMDFVGVCDPDGLPTFVNRAGLNMVGLDNLAEARRVAVKDFFFPEDQSRIVDEFFPKVVQEGRGEIDIRFRNFKTGAARWMAYKVQVLKDASGNLVGFATVSQDITERRQMVDELRRLAANLSETDSRKNEFLATLAHELRNPLAPISNMVEVLKRGDGDRASNERALATIDRQLAHMVRLIEDLLDLSRITHNRLDLRRRQVDLASVIHHAVEATRPLMDAAGHTLHLSLPGKVTYLDADPARLAQVFGNLLSNASKYTHDGGTIWLSAVTNADHVLVSVRDTGVGIPPGKRETIFEMFAQLDSSLVRSQGGLGIGLTLVKRLVAMHGGTVEVRSDGEGKGSEFIVRLPRPVESTTLTDVAAPVATEAAGKARRILVVDDNRDAADSLAMLLQLGGNETFTAHDGLAAVDAVEAHRPHIVLLDIGLPRLSGHDVCRHIRSQPWGKDMTLIALTGWGQEEDRRKSRDAGFDGHLVKPVEFASLTELLASLDAS